MNTDTSTLMTNGTNNGVSVGWKGGKGSLYVEGTFSTQTVVLQSLSPNGTWLQVYAPDGSAVSVSGNGCVFFDLAPGQIRVVATATAVYATAVRYNL